LTLRADSLERGQLRTLVDNLKQKLGEGVVVLARRSPKAKSPHCRRHAGLTKRIQAGKLVGAVAKLVGGSGGGKPKSPKPAAKIRPDRRGAQGRAGDCGRVAGGVQG
jgi:alanyl-tRNA synthetase